MRNGTVRHVLKTMNSDFVYYFYKYVVANNQKPIFHHSILLYAGSLAIVRKESLSGPELNKRSMERQHTLSNNN